MKGQFLPTICDLEIKIATVSLEIYIFGTVRPNNSVIICNSNRNKYENLIEKGRNKVDSYNSRVKNKILMIKRCLVDFL